MEFGAWDGIYLSNCKLFADNGWNGFFIEGDKKRYKSLLSNYKDNKNISCIRKFKCSNYNLNDLVGKYKINNLDILSIDIDGRDLTELKKLKSIEFKLMAERVGFEPTVPLTAHTLSKRAP